MSKDTGNGEDGFKKDPGMRPVDDDAHRDPTVFPLDVHTPSRGAQRGSQPVTPPRRPQTPTRPQTRPQQPRPFQPAPSPAPAPNVNPSSPKSQNKGMGCGCMSWVLSIIIFAALGGYLEPFVRNVIQMIEIIKARKGPEAEFESFKEKHSVANVQLNPRSDPSGYSSIVITGTTGREKRNFFIEKGERYRVSDAQGVRRERVASERIYLKLDDRRYEGFQNAGKDSMVAVSEWSTNDLLRVRISDISFYREAEVTYIENDLASFLQQVNKTTFVPKTLVERMTRGESLEGIDTRFLNETKGLPGPQPGKTDVSQDGEEPETVARFPGGRKAWDEYIDMEIQRTRRKLEREGVYGTVHLSFLVDEQGFVSEVKALPCKTVGSIDCMGPETYAATMLVEAVQRSPRWIPAKKNGRTVPFVKTDKVNLRMKLFEAR